jgi:hypothetical protein
VHAGVCEPELHEGETSWALPSDSCRCNPNIGQFCPPSFQYADNIRYTSFVTKLTDAQAKIKKYSTLELVIK